MQGRNRPDAVDQLAAEYTVFDDVAKRGAGFELAMVVMQKQRRPIVCDPDLEDRLRIGNDVRPQSDGVEDVSRTIGDRGGASVKVLAEHRHRLVAIDDRDREPGTRTSHSEQQTGEPAAGDHQLGISSHLVRMKCPAQTVQALIEKTWST